jgi:RIO kinase 1
MGVFTRRISQATPSALQWLIDVGFISEVIREIKSGKESRVYLVLRRRDESFIYLAAKVHIPRDRRSFRREATYRTGWFIKERTSRKAVEKMTRYGRRFVGSYWVDQEFQTLKRLWKKGAQVPTPILKHGNTIIITYLGDPNEPAPKLNEADLRGEALEDAFNQVLHNLEIFINEDVVHGDLSPYNMLYWEDKVWIIDLPQAVDLHRNPNSMDLLYRDLNNTCLFFNREGLPCSADTLFQRLIGVPYVPGRTYQELLMRESV